MSMESIFRHLADVLTAGMVVPLALLLYLQLVVLRRKRAAPEHATPTGSVEDAARSDI